MIILMKPTLKSPMRIASAWVFREQAIRGLGAIELDVLRHQVDREVDQVRLATSEAAGIEHRIEAAKSLMSHAAGGVLNAREFRGLARSLVGTSVAAHLHTHRLEALQ